MLLNNELTNWSTNCTNPQVSTVDTAGWMPLLNLPLFLYLYTNPSISGSNHINFSIAQEFTLYAYKQMEVFFFSSDKWFS